MPEITVLSPVSLRNASSLFALNQVAAFNAARLASAQSAIVADFQGQINAVNLNADKSFDLQADLKQSVDLLQSLVNRVTNIRNFTDNLLSTVVQSASAGPTLEFAANARNFDVFLSRLTSEANSGRDNPNLLAQSVNRSLTYQVTEAGASQTLAGQFLGTDYTITDTGGQIWVREGNFTKVLRRTDSVTGQPTGEFAAITGGIRLDSFNSTTDEVVFTIAPESADATQFTGTLSRKGLGFLDAWLYAGLETSAGRDRAIVDIEEAKRTIDLELARYGSALTTAEFYEGRVGVQLNSFAGRIDDLTISQAIALQESEVQIGREDALTATLAAGDLAVRNEYLNLFSVGRTAFVDSLINVLA